jgi:hypothetical protein
VKLSNGPLDGVVADSAPDGAAVKKVPLDDPIALAFPEIDARKDVGLTSSISKR